MKFGPTRADHGPRMEISAVLPPTAMANQARISRHRDLRIQRCRWQQCALSPIANGPELNQERFAQRKWIALHWIRERPLPGGHQTSSSDIMNRDGSGGPFRPPTSSIADILSPHGASGNNSGVYVPLGRPKVTPKDRFLHRRTAASREKLRPRRDQHTSASVAGASCSVSRHRNCRLPPLRPARTIFFPEIRCLHQRLRCEA